MNEGIVSNSRKLIYNADCLVATREGRARPVMVNVLPTNLCQLKCPFCCYRDRQAGLSIPTEKLLQLVDDCAKLGCRTWEIAGGGEPTLYPDINRVVGRAHDCDFHLGMCTNGISLDRIEHPEYFQWIRVSLHGIFEHEAVLEKHVELARSAGAKVSCCFVVTRENLQRLNVVKSFAKRLSVRVKMEPDVFVGYDRFRDLAASVRWRIYGDDWLFLDEGTVFSDSGFRCSMHLIKPIVFPDGWLYPCPLPIGPADYGDIDPGFRVCRMEDIVGYYRGSPELIVDRSCRNCRYVEHNQVAEAVFVPLEDKEYC